MNALLLSFGFLALAAPTPPALRLPPGARPLHYQASVSLAPGEERFTASIDIDIDLEVSTSLLWLNGSGLEVKQARLTLGERSLEATAIATTSGFLGFAFPQPVGPGRGRLHAEYSGAISSSEVMGLFQQQEGGQSYAFTQFEDLGARRVFPCFDEPSFKTPWKLTLRIPRGLIAVSNWPVESESGDGPVRTVEFRETALLPSYLVAFAVGPFEVVDAGPAGASHIPLRLLLPKGHLPETKTAAADMAAFLAALEQWFDLPFPFPKLDLVAVPHFDGAMENAGMITADRRTVFPAANAGPARRRLSGAFLAHEIAHQWFGDLVTMEWWNDVWLNEAFASFLETRIPDELHPDWKLEGDFLADRSAAMDADLLLSARSIRQPITSEDDILNSFDEITYLKGQAVLQMFEASVGREVFRRGVRSYLRQHAGHSATTRDFVEALGKEAGLDLSADFSGFLDQPGVPLITVRLSCVAGVGTVHLEQQRLLPLGVEPPKREIWRIPLCLRPEGASTPVCLTLTEAQTDVALADGCAESVQVNEGDAAYTRVRYQGAALSGMARQYPRLAQADRFALMDDAASLFAAGRIPAADALSLAPLAAADDDPLLAAVAIRMSSGLDDASLVTETLRPAYQRWVASLLASRALAAGFAPARGEQERRTIARPLLIFAASEHAGDVHLQEQAGRLAKAFLRQPKAIDPSMRETVLRIAARHGGSTLFDSFWKARHDSADAERATLLHRALFGFRDPALFARALATIGDPLSPIEQLSLVETAFVEPENRDPAWAWAKAHFDELSRGVPSDLAGELLRLPAGFCDPDHRRDVAAFLEPRAAAIKGGPRQFRQTLESIDVCVARRRAQQEEVAAFLRSR